MQLKGIVEADERRLRHLGQEETGEDLRDRADLEEGLCVGGCLRTVVPRSAESPKAMRAAGNDSDRETDLTASEGALGELPDDGLQLGRCGGPWVGMVSAGQTSARETSVSGPAHRRACGNRFLDRRGPPGLVAFIGKARRESTVEDAYGISKATSRFRWARPSRSGVSRTITSRSAQPGRLSACARRPNRHDCLTIGATRLLRSRS
jgi:hypothetical protein